MASWYKKSVPQEEIISRVSPTMSCAKAFLFFFNFIYLVSSVFYSIRLVFEHYVH